VLRYGVIGRVEQSRHKISYSTFANRAVTVQCRKSKTEVIPLANGKGHRQSNEPIKAQGSHTSGMSVRMFEM